MPTIIYLPIYPSINTCLYLPSLLFNFQLLLIFTGQTVHFICLCRPCVDESMDKLLFAWNLAFDQLCNWKCLRF